MLNILYLNHLLRIVLGDKLPKILEPLSNLSLEKFHPCRGAITQETDKVKIRELMDLLAPYMKKLEVGYTGSTNENNKYHGEGTYIYEDGSMYVGSWKNGKLNGFGRRTFSNGSVYSGGFVSNKKHGQGVFTSADGNSFRGNFRANKKHGYGELTDSGEVKVGYWIDDIFYNNITTEEEFLSKSAEIESQNSKINSLRSVSEDESIKLGSTSSPGSPKKCRFFRAGKCRNGDNCTYLHEI
jgi:hypothetical protein